MTLHLLPPSQEPQNLISEPANTKANHQSGEEVKDDTMMKKKMKPSNLEKRNPTGKKKEIMNKDEASSSSCSVSSTSNSNSTRRVSRVAHYRLRNPTARLGMTRRSVCERQAEALAVPLGMSIAAFANLVLERTNAAGQNVYVDDLAMISASAVTESLANVYGNKLGSFATIFEKSFNSTLKVLKLINESANPHQLNNNDVGSCSYDPSTIEGYSDTELSAKETSTAMSSTYEVIQGSATTTCSMNEIVLHEETRQLSCVPASTSKHEITMLCSAMSLTTTERSLEEQARANDLKSMENCLKSVELGLKKREIMLKETELALSNESNNLEKSKAVFREEKYNTELENTRKAEMVTRIMDWLSISVFSMLASMSIGAYNFAVKRIEDATSICESSEEISSLWYIPEQVSKLNSEFNKLICRIRVWVQIFFGVVVMSLFAYFIMQRSSSRKQTMSISFIVIFLSIVCGLLFKVCVDTLGGNGKLWVILWEVFCLFQFVANVFTLALYGLMYGPINATQGTKSSRCNTMFPYWARRIVLYVVFMFLLPAITGLLPFATFGEWTDLAMYHFLGESASNSEV